MWMQTLLTAFIFSVTPLLLQEPKVMTYVEKELPHEGSLCQTREGFLYVGLPKDYVFNVLPLLSKVKACPPPYFAGKSVGAHITVATAEEMASIKIPVPFLGEKIVFSILNLEEISLKNSEIGSKVYVLTIESSQIIEIRKKLGLSPKINGFEFHITIGVDCPL